MIDRPLPALKQMIDIVQIEHEGKPMMLLRDQEGINPQSLALSPAGFLLALLMNGQNSASTIQNIFGTNTGTIVDTKEIQGLSDQLDRAHLLETETLQKKRREILETFLSASVRPAMHLDGFSTADKLDAAVRLGGFFKDSKGPGKEFSSSPSGTPPVGLMSPHIDFHRGGPAYAWAYQALSETPAPDLIVTFGVAHMSPNSPWVMTRKAYQTPYGDMAVHTDLYGEFEKALWYSPTADEWTHRLEHSLEFQAFWLRYLWRDKTPAWLPVLTSSFERFCQDRPPSTIPTIEGAIQKMGDILKKRQDNGEKILILAGVDLAHVGQRFGDEIELTPDVRQKIETEDRVSLKHAMALEADEFYMSAIVDKHWRKNCGLSALYTSLRLIEILQGSSKKSGELLTYGQADDPLGGVVSFASALWKK